MIKYSIGGRIIPWVYDQQIKGKLKWFPIIGEASGFMWMAAIDLAIIVSLITLAIWAI